MVLLVYMLTLFDFYRLNDIICTKILHPKATSISFLVLFGKEINTITHRMVDVVKEKFCDRYMFFFKKKNKANLPKFRMQFLVQKFLFTRMNSDFVKTE